MSNIELSTNLLSDMEFTFDELISISCALENAIEYGKETIASGVPLHSAVSIQEDISNYSVLLLKIDNYLNAHGIDFSTEQLR